MRALVALLYATTLAACATTGEMGTDELEVTEDKADGAGELSLRAGDTTVWVTKDLVRREGGIFGEYALRGRASRNVVGGSAFVIDDPYGDFATRSARTWEVVWPADYVRTLADGTNQFVRLELKPSNGRPDSLTVRALVRPRLQSFTGSSKIYLTAELTPVVYAGTTVYRLKGKTTGTNTAVAVTVGGRAISDVRRTSETEFVVDLAPDTAFYAQPIAITATLANGTTVTKTSELGLSVKKLGLTTEDPYELWPRPTCTTQRTNCLAGLPAATLDLASCGDALEVLACQGQVGVTVDDVAVTSTLTAAHQRTGSTAFRSDARGLAGAAKLEELQGGVEQTIEYRLERQFGRWYHSAASRDVVLNGIVDTTIADAYLRPFDHVEAPHVPIAGNTARIRNVAADALLIYLSETDFTQTGLHQSYAQLVTDQRDTHVASIRAFRETVAVEPYPGSSTTSVLVGEWLGLHTEITIANATGAATGVLVEVD